MNLKTVRVYLWLAAFLFGIEVLLEYRAYTKGWETTLFGPVEPELGMEVAPQGGIAFGPQRDFPFRSPVIKAERPASSRLIWISSASHAEDIYLPPDQVFPNRLPASLSVRGFSCQTINASRAGNSLTVNTAELEAMAPQWRPDFAVLYQMSIDIVGLSKRYLASAAPGDIPEVANPDMLSPLGNRIAKIAEETTTYTLLKANLTPRVGAMRILADELGTAAEADFEQKICTYVDTCRGLDIAPVLCTFATSHGPEAAADLPDEVKYFMLRHNLYLSPTGWISSIDRLNDLIRRIAQEKDVSLVDLSSSMTGHSEYFKDFVHFTPHGHQFVADELAKHIGSRIDHVVSAAKR